MQRSVPRILDPINSMLQGFNHLLRQLLLPSAHHPQNSPRFPASVAPHVPRQPTETGEVNNPWESPMWGQWFDQTSPPDQPDNFGTSTFVPPQQWQIGVSFKSINCSKPTF